jgi:hypothetical protein
MAAMHVERGARGSRLGKLVIITGVIDHPAGAGVS